MHTLDLIRLHMQLECIGIDDQNQLYRIPCSNPDTVHRVYVTRSAEEDRLFFRRDTPLAIRERLECVPVADFFTQPEQIHQILAVHAPCVEMHIGRSYIFPDALDSAQFPDVMRLSSLDSALVRYYDPEMEIRGREVFGILADGMIVSTCESSRENDTAGEAWVRTLEDYRRRGYARQVTLVWAHSLQQQGKVPFYSHTWDNEASRGVAQSLGLIQYIEDAGYA